MVILNKVYFSSNGFLKLVFIEAFKKETSVVIEYAGFMQDEAGDRLVHTEGLIQAPCGHLVTPINVVMMYIGSGIKLVQEKMRGISIPFASVNFKCL